MKNVLPGWAFGSSDPDVGDKKSKLFTQRSWGETLANKKVISVEEQGVKGGREAGSWSRVIHYSTFCRGLVGEREQCELSVGQSRKEGKPYGKGRD